MINLRHSNNSIGIHICTSKTCLRSTSLQLKKVIPHQSSSHSAAISITISQMLVTLTLVQLRIIKILKAVIIYPQILLAVLVLMQVV